MSEYYGLEEPLGHVNRFRVGADPEMAFVATGEMAELLSSYVHADRLGFGLGYCFGADLNRRLVEFRPTASRSVLRVVASTLATLRLMAQVSPVTRKFSWRSGAFFDQDGIGGHIHFGRQTPFRDKEVRALDCLTEALVKWGFFNRREFERRVSNTHYGRWGDIRRQPYGFEYRTMPSWLESPTQMFTALTLAKLVVYNPEVVYSKEWKQGYEIDFPRYLHENLVASYVKRDNDARILYDLIQRWGLHSSRAETIADCRGAWGVPRDTQGQSSYLTRDWEADMRASDLSQRAVPGYIPPSDQDIVELLELFRSNVMLSTNPATWRQQADLAYNQPPGYVSAVHTAFRFRRDSALGDILFELYTPSGIPFSLELQGGFRQPNQIASDSPYPAIWGPVEEYLGTENFSKLRDGLLGIAGHSIRNPRIDRISCKPPQIYMHLFLPAVFKQPGNIRRTRELLLGCGLPLYHAEDSSRERANLDTAKWQRVSSEYREQMSRRRANPEPQPKVLSRLLIHR